MSMIIRGSYNFSWSREQMRAVAGQAVVLCWMLTTEEDPSWMAAGGTPFHGVGQWALSRAPGPVSGQVRQDKLPLQDLGWVGWMIFRV